MSLRKAPPPAVLVFHPDGTGSGLYTEAVDLTRIGRLIVSRTTTIRWHRKRQTWEVLSRARRVLFSDPSRQRCLRWEAENLGNPEDAILKPEEKRKSRSH